MTRNKLIFSTWLLAFMALGLTNAQARKGSKKEAAPQVQLSETGKQLENKYAAMLAALKAEIAKSVPVVDSQKLSALVKARDAAQAAQDKSGSAGGAADRVKTLNTAMGFWKKFGVHQSEQKIEKANAELKAATTDAQREAAKKELAHWTQIKELHEKKIHGAEAEIAKLNPEVAGATKAKEAAKLALTQALANEKIAAKALVGSVEPFLSNDKLDPKLIKANVLAVATPHGLAMFAQHGKEQEGLVDKLLSDDKLMKEMVVAGGAESGKYGEAMEIYSTIQKASSKAVEPEGVFHRLALATSLEFAGSNKNNTAKAHSITSDDQDAEVGPVTVDPVKRYLAYEKAYLNHDLDPAFKNFSAWEYRMVIDSLTSDDVLAWGREMIRNYRPDYLAKDYGWRYSALVKSDVKYGSEGVKHDRPELNEFQNILKDGGVCGRRAFFGRFILRANGIPVWGVTQHKHAALSHWTPKGWVINLGAGFSHSWWDKGDVAMSGSDFLLETQARRHPEDFMKVLRAQWISRVLGEQAYNGRIEIAGGTWSSIGHYLATIIAAQEVELGPLGEELAEANAPEGTEDAEQTTVTKDDLKISVAQDGNITIPAVAHGKPSGTGVAMKSFGGGMQLLGSGGFKTQYAIDAPHAGKYALTARIVTVHDGHKCSFAANDTKAVEVPLPYTTGLWQQTQPVEVSLNKGPNILRFEILGGGRIALKDFTLTPVK